MPKEHPLAIDNIQEALQLTILVVDYDLNQGGNNRGVHWRIGLASLGDDDGVTVVHFHHNVERLVQRRAHHQGQGGLCVSGDEVPIHFFVRLVLPNRLKQQIGLALLGLRQRHVDYKCVKFPTELVHHGAVALLRFARRLRTGATARV